MPLVHPYTCLTRLEYGIPLHNNIPNCCASLQIDYINLTYTSSGMDVYEMREFLDENNGENVKIIAKVRQDHLKRLCNQHLKAKKAGIFISRILP